MNDVIQLLSALEQGDPHAASRLLPLVDEELPQLVRRFDPRKGILGGPFLDQLGMLPQ